MTLEKPKGVALLSVLLIAIVVGAMAYHLVSRQTMSIAQSKQTFEQSRLHELAMSAEANAKETLFDDWNAESSRNIDHLKEAWVEAQTATYPSGNVVVIIHDQQAKFNLNSMTNEYADKNVETFKRLLNEFEISPRVADLWRDWIDEDEIVSQGGAEDSDWLIDTPSRRAPNHVVAHVSELKTLFHIPRQHFHELTEFVGVLPDINAKININTVSTTTLRAMNPDLPNSVLSYMEGNERAFASTEELLKLWPDLHSISGQLDVQSTYFELQIAVSRADRWLTLRSLVHRNSNSGSATVYSREFGVQFPWLTPEFKSNNNAVSTS